MYLIEDTKGAIREIQSYLLELAYIDFLSKKISIDGVYGDDTRGAVMEYQRKSGLLETGEVDRITFENLFRDYVLAKKGRLAPDFLLSGRDFHFKVGDEGPDVLAIHSLLRALSLYERDLPRVPNGAFYSSETSKAIRYMERLFGKEESGEVDYPLYARMQKELLARQQEKRSLHLSDQFD